MKLGTGTVVVMLLALGLFAMMLMGVALELLWTWWVARF